MANDRTNRLSPGGSRALYSTRLLSMFSSDEDAGDRATIHVEPAARRAVITWPPGVPVFNPWMTTIETLLRGIQTSSRSSP